MIDVPFRDCLFLYILMARLVELATTFFFVFLLAPVLFVGSSYCRCATGIGFPRVLNATPGRLDIFAFISLSLISHHTPTILRFLSSCSFSTQPWQATRASLQSQPFLRPTAISTIMPPQMAPLTTLWAADSSEPLAPKPTTSSNSNSNTNHWRAVAVASAVAASIVVLPQAASAVDWSTAAMTASSMTSVTSTWWSSVVETGFYQAFSLVFVSEIGDKTFFIAGLLAMKTSRLISFIGSIGALAAMTVVSVIIGQVFHVVPSGFAEGIPLDDIAAVLAFTFFGIKTLMEALSIEEGESVMDEGTFCLLLD